MAINERLIDTEVAAAEGFTQEVDGLILHLDANDVNSYDGDGDEWVDISTFNINPNTLTQAPPALSSPTPLISYATNDAESYIGTTTWKNLSSATYNAALGGATFSEADGSSLYFDDTTNDSVTTTYSSTGKSAVTWEGWFNLDQVGPNEALGSFSVNGGNVVIYANSTSTNTPSVSFDYVFVRHADLLGDWVHIAVKFTGWAGSYSEYGAGISAEVYINGSSTGTVTVTPYGQTSSYNTIFRVMGNVTTHRAKGLLSTFRFYESGLSDADVLANYNHGRVKFNELETTDLELHLDAASFPQYGESGYSNTPSTWTALTGSNGTISGATFDSELGNWLEFDGAQNDKISVASSTAIQSATSYSIESWINPTTLSGFPHLWSIYGSGNKSFCYINDTNGHVNFSVYNNFGVNALVTNSSLRVEANKWNHVMCTISNGGFLKVYINGEEAGSISQTGTQLTTGTSPFLIGALSGFTAYDFTGGIGQTRLYTSALSANQVKGNYLSTANLYPNGYNGDLISAPTWNSNGYFDFNGSTQKVDLPEGIFPINPIITISTWVKGASFSNSGAPDIICQSAGGGSYTTLFTNVGNLKVYVRDNTPTTFEPITYPLSNFNTSSWYHLLVTYEGLGGSVKLYVNGSNVDSGTSPTTTKTYTTGSSIGGETGSNLLGWSGSISKFKLYHKVLTQAEITALYNEGR